MLFDIPTFQRGLQRHLCEFDAHHAEVKCPRKTLALYADALFVSDSLPGEIKASVRRPRWTSDNSKAVQGADL